MNKYLVFMGSGFELLGIILGAVYVGQIVDKTYSLNGIGTLVFILAGFFGWVYHLIVLLKKLMNSDEDES